MTAMIIGIAADSAWARRGLIERQPVQCLAGSDDDSKCTEKRGEIIKHTFFEAKGYFEC